MILNYVGVPFTLEVLPGSGSVYQEAESLSWLCIPGDGCLSGVH